MSDRDHRISSITTTGPRGDGLAVVVWVMSFEVAEQLAMVLFDRGPHDEGWRADADALFAAIESGDALPGPDVTGGV